MSHHLRAATWVASVLLLLSCQSPTNSSASSASSAAIKITASSVQLLGTIASGDAAVSLVEGHYLYTGGWNSSAGNFQIWDITDLKNPVKHGSLSAGTVYGLVKYGQTVVLQTDGGGTAPFDKGGVVPIDVSSPDAPVAGTADTQGYASDYDDYLYHNYVWNFSASVIGVYGIASGLTWSNNIATTDAEWGAFYGNRLAFLDGPKFRIVNIADPTKPTDVSTSAALSNASAGGTAYYQGRAYLGLSDGRLQVADVTNETAPVFGTPVVIDSDTKAIYDMRVLGSYLLYTTQAAFYVVSLASPDQPTLVAKIDNSTGHLDSNNAWQFSLYQNRYAIVANNVNYRIIQLY